eukprot:CAMPEP_0196791440 /NCGR_PEP_ID=MMETSP1104-20130614/29881_1 /TAXON_ID=33652 /ORGANISM="Cafeteria sp., Strain Caron Lab Isolate" /LENGTH=75 /DNA_ID=CAMNT_0042161805 /DNA_START=56 /DNA_END=280 /DNA_ORIENTATION=-
MRVSEEGEVHLGRQQVFAGEVLLVDGDSFLANVSAHGVNVDFAARPHPVSREVDQGAPRLDDERSSGAHVVHRFA